MKCLISFPVTLKCLALRDLEMPFYAEICFYRRFDYILCLAFGDNCVETNEDTLALSATEMITKYPSFWRHKINANIC